MTYLAFDPAARAWTSASRLGAVPVPELLGRLDIDEDSLDWAARDYGGLVHHQPLAVARPTRASDISAILRFAADHSLPVVPRGQGHSLAGQAQASGGIVVDMRGLHQVHEVTPEHIVVDAGAQWSRVLQATLPLGLTPPVLTDYIGLSVGGTLSVGGLGGTSHQHGAQTDNVLALQVMTADGTLLHCSPQEQRDLFDSVRANYGRSGIITRATLRLVPAPDIVRCRKLKCPSLTSFLNAQRHLVRDGRIDHIEGHIKLGDTGALSFEVETAAFTDAADEATALEGFEREAPTRLPYWNFANRLEEGELVIGEAGIDQSPHPWCNVLLPDEAAESFLTSAGADLQDQLYGAVGLLLAYPLLTSRITTPHLKLPAGELIHLAAALRHADSDFPEAIISMTASNNRWFHDVTAANGTLYAHPFVRG
ncbi:MULTISPECIES: FAD-binding protein [unclassified Crossiella]|uniref:FAD-binding protein n=1 Tax=unclassified Crossiella TaxID=2620835 RepID=UPI0020005836|nr:MULTISPECIES: FAD-binding protein [unclassified Crossiella]MCK2239751.1 FAD-binding protein [Crossiella sp. S99.2]MCK2252446.1 FAD-binding protein [Crossiella sp. S99.1]